MEVLPLQIAAPQERRIHLISIVRPSHDPAETPVHWQGLEFDSTAIDQPFKIGLTKVDGYIVHVFEGKTIGLLLKRLNTAPDFIQYLNSRAKVIEGTPELRFREKDLLALAISEWMQGNGYNIRLPPPNADGVVEINRDLWSAYQESDRARRVDQDYADSVVIDELVNHFHSEYEAGRNFTPTLPSYSEHEQAMRVLASESRFGRRLIASPLFDILRSPATISETGSKSFWAGTVASRDVQSVRYLWLTYPPKPDGMQLEEAERLIFDTLRQYLLVARIKFPERIYVGIGMPGPLNGMLSYFVAILDGNVWSSREQALAEELSSIGILSNAVAETTRIKP